LLVTITGNSVGNVALVDQDLGEAYISQHVGLIRFQQPAVASFVARYLAPGAPGNGQIVASQSGQSKPGLTLKNLHEFSVALPPAAEQRAIADALSDVDALLAGLDRLIAKKRDLKQAAMQQLLTGQTRLPGFQGKWEVKRLEEVFRISVGTSKSAFIVENGDFWICDMGSVSTTGKLIVSKRTNYRGDFLKTGDLIMPKDDIGGGKIIGKVGYIDADDTYVLSDHVYHLRATEGNSLFLAYVINSHRTNRELRKKVIGSAQLGLGRKSVTEQEIQFPPVEEQSAIATVLSDMDAELTTLEARRDKTRALKQAMMQELLTGKTRLV
jgi:type I restriction enzyme S subunit